MMHISPPDINGYSKIQILEIQDGEWPLFWKLALQPILMKLGTVMHIDPPNPIGY